MKIFFSYITARISYIRRDDDGVCFVLDQYNEFDLYSACSLKQQSVGIDVGPLGHIILIPSQPVFALTPYFFFFYSTRARTHDLIHLTLTITPPMKPIWYLNQLSQIFKLYLVSLQSVLMLGETRV